MHTTFKKINDGLDIEEHNKLATMKGFENAVNNYLKNPWIRKHIARGVFIQEWIGRNNLKFPITKEAVRKSSLKYTISFKNLENSIFDTNWNIKPEFKLIAEAIQKDLDVYPHTVSADINLSKESMKIIDELSRIREINNDIFKWFENRTHMTNLFYNEKDASLVSIVEKLQQSKNKEIRFWKSIDEFWKDTLVFEFGKEPVRYLSFHIPDWKWPKLPLGKNPVILQISEWPIAILNEEYSTYWKNYKESWTIWPYGENKNKIFERLRDKVNEKDQ